MKLLNFMKKNNLAVVTIIDTTRKNKNYFLKNGIPEKYSTINIDGYWLYIYENRLWINIEEKINEI